MGWIHFIRHYTNAPWSMALVNVEGIAYTLETQPELLAPRSATRPASPSTSLLVLTLAAVIGCLPGYMRFARLNRWTWLTLASQGYSYAMPRAVRRTGYPRKDPSSVPCAQHPDWVWTWAPSAVTASLCPDDRLTRHGVGMFGGYRARRRVFVPDDWYAPVHVAPLPFELVSEPEWTTLHDEERAWLFWAEPVETAFASLGGVPVLPRQLALRHELRMTPSPLELVVPFASVHADDALPLDHRPSEILPPVGARLPDMPGPRSCSPSGVPSEPRTVLLDPAARPEPEPSLPAPLGYVQAGPTWYERVWDPPGPWTVLDRSLMDPWMSGTLPPCWVPVETLDHTLGHEPANALSDADERSYVDTLVARLRSDPSFVRSSDVEAWCAPSAVGPHLPAPTWMVPTLWPVAASLDVGHDA